MFDAISGGWDEARHRRHFASCWERGGIELLVLEGQPIGMLQVVPGAGHLELSELQILPAHQSRGWGARVVRGLMAAAAQAGLDIELGTGLHNTGAQRLYARLGFRETSRSETHVHMRWSPASELT